MVWDGYMTSLKRRTILMSIPIDFFVLNTFHKGNLFSKNISNAFYIRYRYEKLSRTLRHLRNLISTENSFYHNVLCMWMEIWLKVDFKVDLLIINISNPIHFPGILAWKNFVKKMIFHLVYLPNDSFCWYISLLYEKGALNLILYLLKMACYHCYFHESQNLFTGIQRIFWIVFDT